MEVFSMLVTDFAKFVRGELKMWIDQMDLYTLIKVYY